ncbi:MAG: glycosyltransferase family A protein, partial [Vicinamibacterales bacterium]
MVSILLPTYNRSSFLPAAIGSIRGQTLTDWELVIIDDGSTDDSCERLEALTQPFAERVVFHRQPNAGPYPARNAALDRARGEFIAFFDSDDVWLPHHLERCVDALRANADVDCVYAACRIVDHDTGRVLSPTTFEHDGRPAAFRQLRVRRAGPLHILDDPGLVAASIRHGFYCGLQNAV